MQIQLAQTNRKPLLIPIATLVFALISFVNVKLSLLIIISLYFALLAKWKPWVSLALFIIVVPLSNTWLFAARVGNVPGLDVANLLLVCTVLMYILSSEHLKLSFGELLVIALIILTHGIAFVRSLPYLAYINQYYETDMSPMKYTMSHLVKPISYLFPLILILGYVRSKKRIVFIFKILTFSILLSSIVVISVYLFNIVEKSMWQHVRNVIGDFFGFHSNDIAIFYVIAYPLILANFIYRKTAYSLTCLLLSLFAVGLLYSRTAYVLVIFATVALFLIEKRKKWFLSFCAFLVLALSFSGTTVKERLTVGLEEGDIRTISAGRVDHIWPAVLSRIKNDPFALVVGEGRYAIIHRDRIQKGHPHNMYLEALFDSGIIGLSIFLGCFGYIMKKLFSGIKRTEDEHLKLVLKSALLSMIVFMISGISGRHFFPDITNSYLWIIMALGLASIKVKETEASGNYTSP